MAADKAVSLQHLHTSVQSALDDGRMHYPSPEQFRFRPSATMMKLSYEIFEDDGIRSTAEYTRENYPILSIRGQYLISLVASKLCYLQRSSTKRCPTGAPEPDPFITAGFINIYQVIRLKLGQVVEVIVSQVRILLTRCRAAFFDQFIATRALLMLEIVTMV
ncbi:hypothetical protein PDIDSM_7497 [Penicillium digitatum]|nr:hypothetical protein PDIDSM_7497 [Penicillium digitatum]